MAPVFGLFAALNDAVVIHLNLNGSMSTEQVSLDSVKALYR